MRDEFTIGILWCFENEIFTGGTHQNKINRDKTHVSCTDLSNKFKEKLYGYFSKTVISIKAISRLYMSDDPKLFWKKAISQALSYGKIRINKVNGHGEEIPSPADSGLFKRSIGAIRGQMSDWRTSIDGSTKGVHVVEFRDHYEIHVDKFDPYKKPVEHLLYDSPVYGAILTGASIVALSLIKRIIGK